MGKVRTCLTGIIIVLLLLSCQTHQQGYILTGEIGETPGEKVILKRQVGLEDWVDADSAVVDDQGRFRFKGYLPNPEFVYVYLTGKQKFIRFFLENSEVRILSRYDSTLVQPYVEGSATFDTFRNFRHEVITRYALKIQDLGKRYRQAGTHGDTLLMKKILSEREALVQEQQQFEKQFIIDHRNSVLAPFLLGISYMNYSTETLDSLRSLLDPALDSTLYVKNLDKRIGFRKSSLPGHRAPNFSLPDRFGHFYTLGDWTGKYLVLNFWASWNQRSRNISDDLLPLYERYHEQGFDILSISLDTKKEEWIQLLRKDNLPWVQVIETSGPRGEVPTHYNITGFPQFILIDPEGMIVARLQTVSALRDWLASVYE